MDKGTIVRSVILLLALANQFLIAAGLNPIPGTGETWGEIVSSVFTAVVTAWAWFKNNYVTAKGKKQKEVLQREKLTNVK